MLRTTKNMKDKYENIQNLLFELIPEKWDEIYLYASVIKNREKRLTGEMYFYYIPKSIIKKKPVNVYEVPKRFNINENDYLNIVDKLYQTIKDLRQDFIDSEQDLWTNLTITIANYKFKIEFFYDSVNQDEDENFKRHILWRYKYLSIGGEKKKERDILQKYLNDQSENSNRKEEYQTGLYLRTSNNKVGFDREIEEEKNREELLKQRAIDSEEKRKKRIKAKLEKEEEKQRQNEKRNKNQILK